MRCPRGDHSNLYRLKQVGMPDAYACIICGHIEYDGCPKRMPDSSDMGVKCAQNMTAAQSAQAHEWISRLMRDGYTDAEIRELTGYTYSRVRRSTKGRRKTLTLDAEMR